MIKDIKKIKKELQGYEEISSINLRPSQRIKYITIKDNEELFYLGGYIEKIGDNKIFIYNGGNTWAVPIKLMNKNCKVIYKSRFFLKKKDNKKDKDILELENIIKAQQRIIKGLT